MSAPSTLPVNEIFETLQGEGFWTGTPAVFVRLQGCDVGCPWCDTKHTWARDPKRSGRLGDVLKKVQGTDDDAYAELALADIVDTIGALRARHVVLTGGEPCAFDLTELTSYLADEGLRVQIETSGTYPVLCSAFTWVTVSPKVSMPGGRMVLRQALARADEIKHPFGRVADREVLDRDVLPYVREGTPVFLQPLSLSPTATARATSLAAERGWRVSLQTHRLAGLR